jgi:hypothetical protein
VPIAQSLAFASGELNKTVADHESQIDQLQKWIFWLNEFFNMMLNFFARFSSRPPAKFEP